MKLLIAFLRAIPELVTILRSLHDVVEKISQTLDQHFSRTLDLVEDVVALRGRLAEWEAETEGLLMRADEKFKAARRRENSVAQREKALGATFDPEEVGNPPAVGVAPEDRPDGPLSPLPPGSGGGNSGNPQGEPVASDELLRQQARRIIFGGE